MKILTAASIAAVALVASSPALAVTTFSTGWDTYTDANLQNQGYTQFVGTIEGWTSNQHGVEIQNGVAGAAFSGPNLMEMDVGVGGDPGPYNTTISRTIDRGRYTLTYYYSARPNVTPASTNGVSVDFDGVNLDAVSAAGTGSTVWQQRTVNFVSRTGGILSFSGTGAGEGVGGYIDSVQLTGTDVPEPASWALLIGGFGVAGTAMRRRRSVLKFA